MKSLAEPEIAEHSQRFFKNGPGEYGEGDRFLGIRVPDSRKVAREFKNLPLEEIEKLLRSELHEVRLCSLFMLVSRFQKSDSEMRERIYRLYLSNTAYVNNWDLVDSSAHKIVGEYLLAKKAERKILYTLARSNDLWERRIAIMSTLCFIKNSEFVDTLAIAEILLDDKEDLIHKATGWMLREIGDKDMKAERQFLDAHLPEIPRTMLRYAIEKFPEELRQQYLKG